MTANPRSGESSNRRDGATPVRVLIEIDTTLARVLALVAAILIACSIFLGWVVSQASGATTRPSGPSITGLTTPTGLSVDPANDLWVTDPGNGGLVTEYSPFPANAKIGEQDGEGHFTVGGEFIESAALGRNGKLYVGDSGELDVHVFKPGGEWEETWTGFGSGFDHVTVDDSGTASDGTVYVSQSLPGAVKAFTAAGAPADFSEAALPYVLGNELTGTPTGPGEAVEPFGNAWNMTVAPDGDLYVVERNGKVDQFEASGKFVRQLGAGGAEIFAVAVDATSGNLLIATKTSILELTPAGVLEDEITEANSAPFAAIVGLAVDSTGTLYVADGPNHHVDVLGPAAALPPESDGGSAVDVSSTAATLEAEISPHEHPTAYFFQYGTADCTLDPVGCTDAPVSPLAIGSGKRLVSVAQRLTGLQPGTTYVYRVVLEDTSTGERLPGPDRTFATQPIAPFALPDGRQWELVSPPEKLGSLIAPIEETGVVQASVSGDAITYRANAPTEEAPQGATNGVQILSTRGPAGWGTRDLTVPHRETPGEGIGAGREYRFFTDDLAESFVQPFGAFTASISPEATEQTAFLHVDFPSGDPTALCATGCYHPLVTGATGLANVPEGTVFGQVNPVNPVGPCPRETACGPEFLGATNDGGHAVLRSIVPLTEAAPSQRSLYEWSADAPPAKQLRVISVLPNGAPATEPRLGLEDRSARGAISAEGSRVIFEAGLFETEKALYLRANAMAAPSVSGDCDEAAKGCTLQLDAAEAGCVSCESGGGRFQFASTDGSRVFFTDRRPLTAVASSYPFEEEGEDLYECRIEVDGEGHLACALTDLTPETPTEERAAVQGSVIGASEDGSTVYFAANGVLATKEDSQLEHAEPGACRSAAGIDTAPSGSTCNLYVSHDGETRLVSVLSAEDLHDWAPVLAEIPARVSPSGKWLAFMSQGSLTGYDNRDVNTGKPAAEVFLYSAATDKLVCASCDPTGDRPRGVEYFQLEPGSGGLVGGPRGTWESKALVAANDPGWTANALAGTVARHQPRYLSDSGRLFFNTVNPLVPQDSNGTQDVYQYEPPGVGGCTTSSPTYGQSSEGCVGLISSGTSGQESAFLDASESGNDVFFLTAARLAPQDTDTAFDVYDAHVCTGEVPCLPAPPPSPPACTGDACQLPATPPVDATPGSLSFSGAGNVVQCPKGKVVKKGKCVKKSQPKKHHKKNKGKKHKKVKAGPKNKSAGKKKGGK